MNPGTVVARRLGDSRLREAVCLHPLARGKGDRGVEASLSWLKLQRPAHREMRLEGRGQCRWIQWLIEKAVTLKTLWPRGVRRAV